LTVPAVVDVELEERYWYPEDGGIVWLAGYQPVDPSGRFLARDAPELAAAGPAGDRRGRRRPAPRRGARGGGGRTGRPLELRRDPDNPHDANAIAVHVPGGAQLGWVPRAVAAPLAAELDAGAALAAVILREQRVSPRDPRTGLTMLLARAPAIELRVRG
jgi:hypothetical protein